MLILAADIGGTQARLLLAEAQPQGWHAVRQAILVSRDHSSLDDLLDSFLQPGEQPHAACLAVAGPIREQQVQLTNLPWRIDAGELARRRGLARLELLNDFAAQALGLPLLSAAELHCLQAGQPVANGLRALLGAGTGLGMALLTGPAHAPQVLPSQGGHADFAPVDDEQHALCHYLRRFYPRVSLELLLSGRGLSRIHAFQAGLPPTATALPEAPQIAQRAQAGDTDAQRSLALFARIYLACAGNLALTSLAEGGVYLCGGMAAHLLDYLQQPAALAAFSAKPPMEALLRQVPLQVVLDPLLGLRGAAQRAWQMNRESRP